MQKEIFLKYFSDIPVSVNNLYGDPFLQKENTYSKLDRLCAAKHILQLEQTHFLAAFVHEKEIILKKRKRKNKQESSKYRATRRDNIWFHDSPRVPKA